MLFFSWKIANKNITLSSHIFVCGFISNGIAKMKKANLLLIFAVALLFLFSLQAFWLYYTYRLRLENIRDSINSLFYQTIEKELDQRFFELGKKVMQTTPNSNIRIDSFKIDYNQTKNFTVAPQQFAMVQQLMKTCNIHFDIAGMDSIFHTLLQANQYPFQYQINHTDSIGGIIGTAGNAIDSGFHTAVFRIINGEKVYAIVKITVSVVFKKMFAILVVSIMIFFFIIACLIYEIKIFLNQHQLMRLRENFASALTHDMKTPLASIHSVLVQVENGVIDKVPDMRKKYTAIAIDQTHNLQAIVERILSLASIEQKLLSMNKQSVDLHTMIQSLIDKFTVKIDKNIVFQTFFDLKENVYADSFYLENAISNLIDNAIKYSGDPVKIEIKCITGKKQTNISVKDNGFGISLKDREKIFKRFERGAEIKRNHISGFGIGLNYVQQVIEAHGGTIELLSREGEGSEFVIILPLGK